MDRLSAADIARLPQQTISTTDHGTPAVFQGVRLADVLAKVALPTGEEFHSTASSYTPIVEARDGYRAAFPDKHGPFQLVVPGEKRSARWVRQVAALRIRQAN
jgi:hypothetical protein